MAKANITEYDSTAGNNTVINDIDISEGCSPSTINNAIRELMAHLKNVDTGSQALTALSVTGNVTVAGDIQKTSGDLTLDVAGNIILDSDVGNIRLRDDGTEFAVLINDSTNLNIQSVVQDKDIKFTGNDGGSGITALTLDMSDAGSATFNHDVILPYNGVLAFNSTSNQYIQADSSNLFIGTGGSGRIIIDTNGHTTMPHQPAFAVSPASTQSDLAINTVVDIVFGTEYIDRNADFASNTFTAPVTGLYQLSVHIYTTNLDVTANYVQFNLSTSNRGYTHVIGPNFSSDLEYYPVAITALADMDAGDTAKVQFYQSGGDAQD